MVEYADWVEPESHRVSRLEGKAKRDAEALGDIRDIARNVDTDSVSDMRAAFRAILDRAIT